MGELICLEERRALHRRPAPLPRPKFFFDVACPLSYLAAERIERALGRADWVAVPATALGADRDLRGLRHRAQARAQTLRMPLVWPERFAAQAPCALRATVRATELGAGPRFALAAARLAFCGGFDLEDPETMAEAAAAAGVPVAECLAAAGDPRYDRQLHDVARRLRSSGIEEVPAIELDGRLLSDESGLVAVRALRDRVMDSARPLAPAG